MTTSLTSGHLKNNRLKELLKEAEITIMIKQDPLQPLGTGLGLAISKNLAELMKGTLTVESRVGEGSIFIFDCTFKVIGYQDEWKHDVI